MNKDSNNLLSIKEGIKKEIERRRNDLFHDIDDLKRMSNFFSDSLKLTIDDALMPRIVEKVLTESKPQLYSDENKFLRENIEKLKDKVTILDSLLEPSNTSNVNNRKQIPAIKRSTLFPNADIDSITGNTLLGNSTALPHSTLVRATSGGTPYNCYIVEHCVVDGILHYNAETTDSNLISFPATAINEILQHPSPSSYPSPFQSSLPPQGNSHQDNYHADVPDKVAIMKHRFLHELEMADEEKIAILDHLDMEVTRLMITAERRCSKKKTYGIYHWSPELALADQAYSHSKHVLQDF